MKIKFLRGLLFTSAIMAAPAMANELQSLHNMERERAALIEALRDPALGAEERHARMQAMETRLVDLERLVLRDDRLLGHRDRVVQVTFRDYDRSFLIHAAAEAKVSVAEHWLAQLGLSNNDLRAAVAGRR